MSAAKYTVTTRWLAITGSSAWVMHPGARRLTRGLPQGVYTLGVRSIRKSRCNCSRNVKPSDRGRRIFGMGRRIVLPLRVSLPFSLRARFYCRWFYCAILSCTGTDIYGVTKVRFSPIIRNRERGWKGCQFYFDIDASLQSHSSCA